MRTFVELNIEGVFEIQMFNASDDRGTFVKPYHAPTLAAKGLVSDYKESFFSTNHTGVIRGMHFQHPPHDHAKLVYCTSGKLIDVVLDLRRDSKTYGQWAEIELSAAKHNAVYMPTGVAHGFKVTENNTCMVYLTSTVHNPHSDDGIRYDSFGYDWGLDAPIISERDLSFSPFSTFHSPF